MFIYKIPLIRISHMHYKVMWVPPTDKTYEKVSYQDKSIIINLQELKSKFTIWKLYFVWV